MDDRRLDALLKDWASAPAGDAAAHARIIKGAGGMIDRSAGRRPWQGRWLAGGIGVAASVAVALLALQPAATVDPAPDASVTPDAAFAALYTPTPLEEQLL